MSTVYFARPRTWYDSYGDLYRLIELSGYPLIYFDEIDHSSQNCYILTVMNGDIPMEGWPHTRATIILIDGEWRLKDSGYAWPESDLVLRPGISRVWAGDKWYASRINAEYVPLGSHPGLALDGTADGQGWDAATLCYHSGRRQPIIAALQEQGLSLAPNAWGDERDALLKEAKAVIHIHQHDRIPTVAPLRYALAAAYHKPLISEAVYDRGIFDGAVLFADKDTLPEYAALLIRRYPALLQDKADELHDRLVVSNNFRTFIEKAL